MYSNFQKAEFELSGHVDSQQRRIIISIVTPSMICSGPQFMWESTMNEHEVFTQSCQMQDWKSMQPKHSSPEYKCNTNSIFLLKQAFSEFKETNTEFSMFNLYHLLKFWCMLQTSEIVQAIVFQGQVGVWRIERVLILLKLHVDTNSWGYHGWPRKWTNGSSSVDFFSPPQSVSNTP